MEGMKYPLQDGELTNSFPLGVSNEISSEISYTQRASVTVREGKALMILTKSRGDFSSFDPLTIERQPLTIRSEGC